jgi:methionyl-tRNA formyltransferase
MTGSLLGYSEGHTTRILVLGQNEALYRFLCACVTLKRVHSFDLIVCTPVNAANKDTFNFSVLSSKFGFRWCETDCTEDDLFHIVTETQPQILVSVLYPKKINSKILNAVRDKINFHPSLLPEHRGSLTQFWSIFSGDAHAGVTCHHMVAELDQGAILDQESCPVEPDETAFSLNRKLLTCFETLSLRIMGEYLEQGFLMKGQDQEMPKSEYHFRKFPSDGYIDVSWSTDKIDRFVRAMYCPPYIGARLRCPDGREYEVTTMDEYDYICAREYPK